MIQKEYEGQSLDDTVMNSMQVPKKEAEEAKQFWQKHPDKCFLFVDALDEFRNERVIREIFECAAKKSTNLLITCRDGHPYLDYQMGKFSRHVKVAGFEPDDAINFIKKFMKSLVDDKSTSRDEQNESIMCNDATAGDEKCERICEHIKRERFNKLYTSPINCAFICLLYSEGEINDEDLSSMTMLKLFTKQQQYLLNLECLRQSSSLDEANLVLRKIHQLAVHSLIHPNGQSWYSSEQLKEFDIDSTSPAMVLLSREKKSSHKGEYNYFSWPHETIKEYHAARALKNNDNIDILYVIASKPELNVVTDFIISMTDENDLEMVKTLLLAKILLQSEEPSCVSSWRWWNPCGHCQISQLKKDIQGLDTNTLFKESGIFRNLDSAKIQRCMQKTDWMVKNWAEYAKATLSIKEVSQDCLQRQLHRCILHPFLPSIATGDLALDLICEGKTDEDPINWCELRNAKDITAFVYPCYDDAYHSMVGWCFDRTCEDKLITKEDNDPSQLEGRFLFLFLDTTIKHDHEYTTQSLHKLAQEVQMIDFLVLDVNEGQKMIPCSKESITFIEDTLKPRKGVILRRELAKRLTDPDLQALGLRGVHSAHVGYFGEIDVPLLYGDRDREVVERRDWPCRIL